MPKRRASALLLGDRREDDRVPPKPIRQQPRRHTIVPQYSPLKKRRTSSLNKRPLDELLVANIKIGSVEAADLAQTPVTDAQVPESTEAKPGTGAKDKRILRSQGGATRGNSELALFFPDYEEHVFGPDHAPDLINVGSTLYLTDVKPALKSTTLPIRVRDASPSAAPTRQHVSAQRSNPELLDYSVYDAEVRTFRRDPLGDQYYRRAHEKGERSERRLRNLEKERATHEKSQLDKLYQELRGADWLKTMGVSGVTETEKKSFEEKRDHYIKRVKALLVKFDDWREKEKEQRQRKERMLARATADDEDSGSEPASEEDEDEAEDEEDPDRSSDLADESALQLHTEAGLAPPRRYKQRKAVSPEDAEDPRPRPFVSFFAKPRDRAGAMGKHRRGRHAAAFGQPIPAMPEQVAFVLPADF